MGKKSPQISHSNKGIDPKKIPESKYSPAQFSNHYISWQICSIDMDGDWNHTFLKPKFKLIQDEEFENSVLNILDDNTDLFNHLSSALKKNNNQIFNSKEDCLNSLFEKYENDIPFKIVALCLKSIKADNTQLEIFKKIKHFENKRWDELYKETHGRKGKTKHHYIPFNKLTKKARKRLEKLKLDDIESLYSFRLQGEFRIIGIRMYGFLRVLWIDPKHEVALSRWNNNK